MVLPPPTAAEGEAPEAEWLREVRRWLTLGKSGVIVAIRDAKPSQLRPLARLLQSMGEPTITTDARALLDCSEGALALLLVRERDLDWLNLNRPLFAQRSLRAVLWVEADLTAKLRFASPDLHDWVSHFVVCPDKVPEFAVEGLRVGCSWWPGISWTGPLLERALTELGIDATPLAAASDFETLVARLRADRQAPVRWTGVDSLRDLWRVRWAVAEARHEGVGVLDNPSVRTPGWFPVASEVMTIEQVAGLEPLDELFDVEFELGWLRDGTNRPVPLAEIGLLSLAGPSLRERHATDEVAGWRRALVDRIRDQPTRRWSRYELAVFASLERDSDSWPVFLGSGAEMRFHAEHQLRLGLLAPASVPAAYLGDEELVRRWAGGSSFREHVAALGQRFGQPLSVPDVTPDTFESPPKPGEVLEFIRRNDWDAPGARRAVLETIESLLDRPDTLAAFLRNLEHEVRASFGAEDSEVDHFAWVSAIALTLAGLDPVVEGLPVRLTDLLGASAVAPTYRDMAAIDIVRGRFEHAIERLTIEPSGELETRKLLVAALLAAGESMRAVELVAEVSPTASGPSEFLDGASPVEVARAYLLERLRTM